VGNLPNIRKENLFFVRDMPNHNLSGNFLQQNSLKKSSKK
jgi:hypothetical protein